MYAQVDSEGNQYQLLSEITDHRTDHSAIQIADSYKTSRNGSCVPKSTTRRWSLLVSWKEGSSDWVPLKDLKDYYPIQIAEALAIDDQTGTDFWQKALGKEINKVKVAWTAADGVSPKQA